MPLKRPNNPKRYSHAYIIVYYSDPDNDEIFTLSGREQALHFQAISQLKGSMSSEEMMQFANALMQILQYYQTKTAAQ